MLKGEICSLNMSSIQKHRNIVNESPPDCSYGVKYCQGKYLGVIAVKLTFDLL